MANVKTVRNIMRNFGKFKTDIWTNKLKDEKYRSVKCFYNSFSDSDLVAELIKVAGPENVKVVNNERRNENCIGRMAYVNDSIIVKCEFV